MQRFQFAMVLAESLIDQQDILSDFLRNVISDECFRKVMVCGFRHESVDFCVPRDDRGFSEGSPDPQ